MAKNQKKKQENKIYKSLYDVKNKYLPHADLKLLEKEDDVSTQDLINQAIERITHPVRAHSCD